MYRTNSNGSQVLRRFVQHAESYNRCMFPNNSSITINKQSQSINNHITEQILFCQNGIDNLNISSTRSNSAFKKTSDKEIYSLTNEILMVDIVSNGYKYETSSLELNIIQQCCIVSIISPYAFTIQLTKDLIACDAFFKTMNDYYNSIDDLHISSEYLRKNLLCVTWDATALAWNRSQIMEYDLVDDTVNVFFVDLNSWDEHVPRSRLRFILTKYSSRPVYLSTCRLASIAPLNNNNNNDNQWNDVVSKTFQNVVQNCQCDVEPLYKGRDNTFYVNLFALHDEAYVCLNDFLIHCKMAKPIDDISNEKNLIYMLDDNGQPMHSMIALYWNAGEAMRETETCVKKQNDDHQLSGSTELFQTKSISLIKVVMINEYDKLIFARYNSYIMLPWFTISNVLPEYNEEKIKNFANNFGFKPIIIDPLSDPLLCSQLIKLKSSKLISSQISLYSIDCVRKIFQISHYIQPDVYNLLDRARLAEASNDISFWDKSYESLPNNITNESLILDKM
ncbi:unnamed protein product [Rotaria sp. Silwood1]|nr:unnamed protein product [Rotaria sp. Silwood1]CAF0955409.1 unnamed protein product [Rotaria sp. Silwood1]CAF3421170.1 unnamed protein product [Rotaria sp. Silwood1]CAF3478452.1 unnamed protein product [Rotaria sp. Silwood1]CAF4738999.1 unnamed protein product [Rotaria sp. Silwood1]